MKKKIKLVSLFTVLLFLYQLIHPVVYEKLQAELYMSVSGKVVDAETNEGIEGVEVVIEEIKDNQLTGRIGYTTTDKKGRYIFDMVPPGEYQLFAYPVNLREYIVELTYKKIRVKRGYNIVDLNFILKKGGIISGTIFLSDGLTPAPNLDIIVFTNEGWFEITSTNANGEYVVSGLPPSKSFVLNISVFGYFMKRENLSIDSYETLKNINFTIPTESPALVTGKVLSSKDNTPVKDAVVILAKDDVFVIGKTDGTGKYSIRGLPGGNYEAWVYAQGYSELHQIGIQINKGITTFVDFLLPLHTSKGGRKGRYAPCEGKKWPWSWICRKMVDWACSGLKACLGCCFADYMKCLNDAEKCPEDKMEKALLECHRKYANCQAGCGMKQ